MLFGRRVPLVRGASDPIELTFYFRFTNTQGNADAQFKWGQSGWLPVSGNFGLG